MILTLVSFPFLYYSLDLPKTIVNQAIGGHHFPAPFLGMEFDQIPYLMTLCGVFLVLVFINGGFKYYINTCKGQLGERMLRRFRYALYLRLLRFPTTYFHKTSSAQIIPMITTECEQLGGFIGDAFVLPAFQGGTLLTLIIFMFIQNWQLGLAAVALYPIQGWIIPKLQRIVNQLGKRRIRTIRVVADQVQESAAGIAEIQANDTVKLRLSHFAHILGVIYDIRYEIYQRKFFVKFLNNFIGQLTPFFFYSIGGYLVIKGHGDPNGLTFGALVAVLAAYKDLASPWKELLDFYQNNQNSRITYDQIVEQFEPANMIDAEVLLAEPQVVPHLTGELAVANLSLAGDDNSRVVDGVSFNLALDEHAAIIGQSGSGKGELALLLARLVNPSTGRITIGGTDLATLPLAVVGRRIGYANATPYMFTGTLRDNLLLGLRHRPVGTPDYGEEMAKKRAKQLLEARRTGNIDFDIDADWVDYASAGIADAHELSLRTAEVLAELGFEEDVYTFGLRGRVDPAANPALADRLLEARKALSQRLARDGITELVETYDPERYNTNATVAENVLFGTPIGPVFEFDALAENRYVLQVLDKVGLTDDLVEAGREVAATMTEIFADLPPDHEFFEQYSFINAADLPEFAAILAAAEHGDLKALTVEQRHKLLSLPFKLIAARHRLDVLDERMQQRLLEARRVFRADLPAAAKDQIAFFDPAAYNAAASLQDNILFGKIAYGESDAMERVPQVLGEVLDEMKLRPAVINVGLDYHVGTAGSRLSLGQRQRAAIARAVLKRPDLMILSEATSALDGQAQVKVTEGLRAELAGRGLIWVLHRASLARNFDRVLVMSGGKLQEQGTVRRPRQQGFADQLADGGGVRARRRRQGEENEGEPAAGIRGAPPSAVLRRDRALEAEAARFYERAGRVRRRQDPLPSGRPRRRRLSDHRRRGGHRARRAGGTDHRRHPRRQRVRRRYGDPHRRAARRDGARQGPARRPAHRQGPVHAHGARVPQHGGVDHAGAGAPRRIDQQPAALRAQRGPQAARKRRRSRRGVSRLDSFIRRLQAQRACLDRAAELVRGLDGAVLELGLGNGRTYDHLRELFPARDIYVCERRVAAHPDCIPPADRLLLGDMFDTLPAARFLTGRVVLAHFDAGTGDAAANRRLAAGLRPLIVPLMRGGGVLATQQEMACPELEALPLPDGVADGRYHLYRRAG